MILGSTNVSKLMLGSTAVQKVMLGATEVWSGFDADFAAYLAAGIANGSTMSAANQTAVNAFIVGCKADGIWSAIKASCLLCAWDSLSGALTPLVGSAPTNNNFVSGDYSRTAGLTGNPSASAYIDTNRANNADPQDNQHLCAWVGSAGTSGRFAAGGGSTATGASILGTGGGVRSQSSTLDTSATSPTGLFGISRAASSGFTVRANGTNYAKTRTSETPATNSIWIYDSNPSIIGNSDGRYSFYSIGESLDLALLDARLTTLMGALT